MKGIHGLIIAIGLGIAATIFNWLYLQQKSKHTEMVYFIGVAAGETIGRGEVFTEDKLVKVPIPKEYAKNLKDFAVPWDALSSVTDVRARAPRLIEPGSLLLEWDLEGALQELDLEGGDLIWVNVDPRSCVPSLINPGDHVSFLVAAPHLAPPPSETEGLTTDEGASGETTYSPLGGQTRPIGPFLVISMGNRLGTSNALVAAKIAQVQENTMGILITDADSKKAQALQSAQQATGNRPVRIRLHLPKKK
jgi:hypothetical protein